MSYRSFTTNNAGTAGLAFASNLSEPGLASVKVGVDAGLYSQGTNCVALGAYAGYTGQLANTIVINATGSALNTSTSNALFVAPIRTVSSTAGTLSLRYLTATNEVVAYEP